MGLKEELLACGWLAGTPLEFKEILEEVFCARYPSWTVDRLLINPQEGLRYCAAVRKRSFPGLPDALILGTLLNRRRGGHLARGEGKEGDKRDE